MKTFGNILWVIFGGWTVALGWLFYGIFWCVTIVGIPLGKQCFKFAKLTFMPFNKEIVYTGGTGTTVANVFWAIFTGIEMALGNIFTGLFLCCTIVGIPFAKQYFKFAKLSFAPFGFKVEKI